MRIRDWSSDACSSDLIIKGSALAALEDSNEEIGRKAVIELMKQVDAYIPEPERPLDKPFMMPIEDVFSISGRGTVVTGRVETGIIKVGEERSEEHTSELQSLIRNSYAVFCLQKKNSTIHNKNNPKQTHILTTYK